MTGRLTGASMTRGLARPSGATTAAAPGRRFVERAILDRRSGVTTSLIHLDQQVTVKVGARMGHQGVVNGLRMHREGATGRRMREEATDLRTRVEVIGRRMRVGATDHHTQREGATGRRSYEGATGRRSYGGATGRRSYGGATGRRSYGGATGRRMQHVAETTVLVPRFDATIAADGRRFAETTGRIRPGRHVMATVNVRTDATARRGAATGRRMPRGVPRGVHHEAAVRGRSRLGRAALGRAVRAGTTIRGRCGTRATRRAAAGRSRHGRVVAALRIGREAGRRSGRDRLGAKVQAANAAVMAEGQAVEAGLVGLAEGHRAATVHRGGTATPAAMRDRRAVRRIEAGAQAARRGAAAVRAGRRATRRDGLVAGRDL